MAYKEQLLISKELRELESKATPGKWEAWEDGNQYTDCSSLSSPKLSAATKIKGLPRYWNPFAYIAFGHNHQEMETTRVKQEDGRFLVAIRNRIIEVLDKLDEYYSLFMQGKRYLHDIYFIVQNSDCVHCKRVTERVEIIVQHNPSYKDLINKDGN